MAWHKAFSITIAIHEQDRPLLEKLRTKHLEKETPVS